MKKSLKQKSITCNSELKKSFNLTWTKQGHHDSSLAIFDAVKSFGTCIASFLEHAYSKHHSLIMFATNDTIGIGSSPNRKFNQKSIPCYGFPKAQVILI